jgi:predicted nucleic acid-binding protein
LKASGSSELVRAEDALSRTDAFCSGFPVVGIGPAAASVFSTLLATKGLKKLGRGDLLNASVCLATGATLITCNLKVYGLVPGLRAENWAA